jgi:hypothetical protein
MKVYQGLFSSSEYVACAFQDESVLDYEILLAAYTDEDYTGDAYVLARKDGKLYEVEGGHCSCYGLEDQWKPMEVTIEYLLMRLERGVIMHGIVPEDTLRRVIESL